MDVNKSELTMKAANFLFLLYVRFLHFWNLINTVKIEWQWQIGWWTSRRGPAGNWTVALYLSRFEVGWRMAGNAAKSYGVPHRANHCTNASTTVSLHPPLQHLVIEQDRETLRDPCISLQSPHPLLSRSLLLSLYRKKITASFYFLST